jgi:hypothetical protein
LTGVILFPLLMPWLPSKDYSTRGFFLGGLYALGVVLLATLRADAAPAVKAVAAASHFLIWPALVGYFALNFTGATPYPSRSGVRREIYRYIRPMAVMFGLGLVLNIVAGFMRG